MCVVLGALFTIAWLIWVAVESNGYSHMQAKGWGLLGVISFIAYFAPFLIYRVIAWVRDGFNSNTQVK